MTNLIIKQIRGNNESLLIDYSINGVNYSDTFSDIAELMGVYKLSYNPIKQLEYTTGASRANPITPLEQSLRELELNQNDEELNFYYNNFNWDNLKDYEKNKTPLSRRLLLH